MQSHKRQNDLCSFPGQTIQYHSESQIRSLVSNSLQPHGLYSPWNALGHNAVVVAFPFSRGSLQHYHSNPSPCPNSTAEEAEIEWF